MTAQQNFGGSWTGEKLSRLGDYLKAYQQALKNQTFTTVYVDAFAGTGTHRRGSSQEEELLKGSARVALDVQPMFDRYLFIERSQRKCNELNLLKSEYPAHATRIQVAKADANDYLLNWCQMTNWKSTRAVVFLDPFGMQVRWEVLEELAKTRAVDLWLLVPLGIGANRLLTQDGLPSEQWSSKLTTFFGTEEWKTAFYKPRPQLDLFSEEAAFEKDTDHERLAAFFIERLNGIFAGVAKNPLVQKNRHNSPMFLLCFAAANPKGASIALRIAEHLLKE